jgi:uncharacterized repeat protein (TIGR01451 family)
MKCPQHRLFAAVIFLLLGSLPSPAQLHRATRLGNPATRFAPPLFTQDDLRARFRDEKLKPDFVAVLNQWGWHGDPADMFRAAATNEITDTSIKVGERMPFMSTRENGRAICLRDVLWAGKEPAPAYAFNFSSKGRRYRCVTPKACSNFFVEDHGPEPKPALALSCNAPDEVTTGRAADVCFTLVNHGNAVAPRTTLVLPIPPNARLASKTDFAAVQSNQLVWEIAGLEPNKGKQVCATFKMAQPGTLSFSATATSAVTNKVSTACETRVVGVPAILLEVIDLEDPVEVGKEVAYEIKVTNQGTSTGTNIRLTCELPKSQQFISATGNTPVTCTDSVITMKETPALPPKEAVSWQVKVKALEADDARFKVELRSDQFEKPIMEDESTQLY